MIRSDAHIIGGLGGDASQGVAKPVTLTVTETNQQHPLALLPGVTPRDIRERFNLPVETILTPAHGAEPFGDDENIYARIPTGGVVYAATPVEAGGE